MANANKATLLNQLQATANRIKRYILQQIGDLANAVQADMDAKYTKPSGGIPKEDLSQEILASLSSGELLGSFLPSCPVERVEDGTRFFAKITGRKLCAQVGFLYEADAPDKLRILAILGLTNVPNLASRKAYRLIALNAPTTPTELTIENTEASELPIGRNETYNVRFTVSDFSESSPADVRLVIIGYDADGNEIERVYSSQYRYAYDNGVVTRTKFATANTSADHIVDVGLAANANSSEEKWGGLYSNWGNDTLIPLNSTSNTSSYNFVVPDAYFQDKAYGLRIVVISGTGLGYSGPNVYKAPEVSSLPAVTSADNGKVLMVVNGDWAAGSIPSAVGVSF